MDKSDEKWKRRLSPEEYHVLREGVLEPPRYTRGLPPLRSGSYVCVGCGQVLFLADDRTDDGSGYLCFTAQAAPNAVREEGQYAADGSTRVNLYCTRCNGFVGRVSDMGLRSAQDLEDGVEQHLLRVSAVATAFHPSFTPSNFPIVYAFLAVVLVVGVGVVYTTGVRLVGISEGQHMNSTIELAAGGALFEAATYTPPNVEAIDVDGSMLGEHTALFVVLSAKSDVVVLRNLPTSTSVAWVNGDMRVTSLVSYGFSGERVTIPDGTKFVLVLHDVQSNTSSVQEGVVLFFPNKTQLF